MNDIDYLIEYEAEGTNLDFKATQYRKEQYCELLKDVIAMANAITDGERLIITGVKKQPDGSYSVNTISEADFIDSAAYQQLILDNIEPEIHIEYIPHLFKGSQLVGVIKIPACPDKPYMMKKPYNSDKQVRKLGESFIRKGTTTYPLTRKDIDLQFEQRKLKDVFTHQVSCYFSGHQKQRVLEIKPASVERLPSRRQAERIKAIIDKKEKQREEQKRKAAQDTIYGKISLQALTQLEAITSGYSVPYENRSLETLRKDLEKVGKTYLDDDCYVLFEKRAEKINITILNEGTKYLEDAVVEVQIPVVEGLYIADKIYKKPIESPPYGINYDIDVNGLNAFYPVFEQKDGVHTFSQSLKDLRHLQPKEVFSVPLRITITPLLAGQEIEIKIIMFGKNLPSFISDTLILKVSQ